MNPSNPPMMMVMKAYLLRKQLIAAHIKNMQTEVPTSVYEQCSMIKMT